METKAPQPIITPGSKIEKSVSFQGQVYNLILVMKKYTYPDHSFELIDHVTNQDGQKLTGIWHWGTYGARHKERLEFDTRPGEGYLTFHTESSWCNGRLKNGRKRLIAIVVE